MTACSIWAPDPGVNAILAAQVADDVVGVDLNPEAVAAARANAARNGVWAAFAVSDVFSAVHGTFDLIIIDPPFRWFAPRDMRRGGR
jgi:release factor glutamine methyltransferase